MEFENVFEMYADHVANYSWNPLHNLLDFWPYTLFLLLHSFDTRISLFRHLVLKNKGQTSLPTNKELDISLIMTNLPHMSDMKIGISKHGHIKPQLQLFVHNFSQLMLACS